MNSVDEVEVWLTRDGLGRAAIARTEDGEFCIYVHWKLAPEVIAASNLVVRHGYAAKWTDDRTPTAKLYEDIEPQAENYKTLEDARRQIQSLAGFRGATKKT